MGCDTVVRDCQCDDFPIVNLSAEAADFPVFVGIGRYDPDIPDNNSFSKQGCTSWCFSTISQAAADACALAQAQDCVVDPGGPGGPCTGICTPGGDPTILFGSTEQTCNGLCSDGSPITVIVPPNTYRSLISFTDANVKAAAICRQTHAAIARYACVPLAPCCIDSALPVEYVHAFNVLAGSPPWLYSTVAGGIPGLTLSADGVLSGIPAATGQHSITIEAVDQTGIIWRRAITLPVIELTSATELTDAALGAAYSHPLTQSGGAAPFSWTIVPDVGEGLPPGLTLDEATGVISGTPEEDPEIPSDGIYHFRVRFQDQAS